MKNKSYKDTDIIRASEIGQYLFCSISWYLQKCGYKPISPNLEIGIKKHENLGRIIEISKNKSKKSKVLEVIGYFIFFIGIFLFFTEVIL
jgi:hypothetical protein